MADINKCIFTGRIGNDVELRTTASGTSVCSLRLAVERPKAKGAEKAEADWLNVIAWRQQAEFVSRYLGKGRKVVVECEVRNRQWTDKQGNQRVSTEFNVAEHLSSGVNYVKIQVTGGESGMIKTLTFTINVVDIALTSTFSDTQAYTSSISFLYRVTGKSLKKTMYFYVDGELYNEVDIGTAHNVQLTETLNLARFGHGHHILTCYFITEDGARSPELTYDVIFDAAEAATIIGSTFAETEVTYGETITVDYVVHTHGSDYTSEVKLGIYTLDAAGGKKYYDQKKLANVVNQSIQKWNITDYPESGNIYLEITAGSTVRTFSLTVNAIGGDRDLSGVNTRLIASFMASLFLTGSCS